MTLEMRIVLGHTEKSSGFVTVEKYFGLLPEEEGTILR
jgi:hypothetical protein